MGIWAWIILLVAAAAVATVVQALFFSRGRRSNDDDWIYLGAGALVGGFTGHAWYAAGPTLDGLNLVPAFVGLLAGALTVEAVHRLVLRPRQA